MSNLYDLFAHEQLVEQLAMIDFDESDLRAVLFARQRMEYEHHKPRTTISGNGVQLNLGQLIDKLESFPFSAADAVVRFNDVYKINGHINSFRGINAELSVEYANDNHLNSVTLIRFIQILLSGVNNTYFGWKGGEYQMSRNTPLWVTNTGRSHGFQMYDDDDDGYACIQAIIGAELDTINNVVYLKTDGVIAC